LEFKLTEVMHTTAYPVVYKNYTIPFYTSIAQMASYSWIIEILFFLNTSA